MRGWLREGNPLAMSTIAWTEFLCGPLKSGEFELAGRLLDHLLPFRVEDAEVVAELFNHCGRRRGSLIDCMVAATAITHNVPLATSNPSDFRRMEARGLEIVAG